MSKLNHDSFSLLHCGTSKSQTFPNKKRIESDFLGMAAHQKGKICRADELCPTARGTPQSSYVGEKQQVEQKQSQRSVMQGHWVENRALKSSSELSSYGVLFHFFIFFWPSKCGRLVEPNVGAWFGPGCFCPQTGW